MCTFEGNAGGSQEMPVGSQCRHDGDSDSISSRATELAVFARSWLCRVEGNDHGQFLVLISAAQNVFRLRIGIV